MESTPPSMTVSACNVKRVHNMEIRLIVEVGDTVVLTPSE